MTNDVAAKEREHDRSRKPDRHPKKRLKVEPLTPHEVRQIINVCNPRYPTGLRDRALITCWYRGGLRLTESLDLLEKDLDRDNGIVRILHGKGDRSRVVGMDEAAWIIMDKWVTRRRSQWNPDPDVPLFCSYNLNRFHRGTVRCMTYRRAKKAGITKRVHPHGFRHTCAFEMMQEGVSLVVIQKHLGHADLSTTQIYLDHLTNKDAADIVRQRTWDMAPVTLPDPPKPKTDLREFRKLCEEGLTEIAISERGDTVLVIASQDKSEQYQCFSYQAPRGAWDGNGDWQVVVERSDVGCEEAMRWMALSGSP